MNEIKKLYENAGIKPIHYDACKIADAYWLNEELANEYGTFDNYMKLNCPYKYKECTDNCRHAFDRDTYPPSTAEKQIKLLEFDYKYSRVPAIGYVIELKKYDCPRYDYGAFDTFQEVLCADINYHWQFLTDKEKEQIRNILKG